MRWIITIAILLALEVYAFQAFRTLFKFWWSLSVYVGITVVVLGLLFYSFYQPTPHGSLTGFRAYMIGAFLSIIALKLSVILWMFGEDIVRLSVFVYRKFSTSSVENIPSRRKFISTIALGLGAIPFLSLLYGMYKGKYNFKVLSYELEFDNLPEAFEGYQITQLSDIHSGSFDNAKKIEYAIDLVNEQESDVILFTGDLVNNLADEMTPWTSVFKKLKSKDGVFSILGNHDYGDYHNFESQDKKQKNFEALVQTHAEMGWDLLRNENREIRRGQSKLKLIGVENWGKGGFKKAGDFDKAAEGVDAKDFKILMSHDPSHWDEVIKNHEKDVQLTLSGHTHGMQFGIEIPGWFKWSPVQYRYDQWAGLYENAKRFINVNRGFGYLAYPGRVGIWPEITVIKLKRKSASEV
ncbi:metallophosphoesterase [Psychroflexus sp. CAK8W]|uniref:Metallophosphoesterase n=1 Tax=Psychroflexus longus TaxID=2873596 RepID=A0ABS7XFT9_9FLAO|nr:metallophosphoesterase [Psychroflexus longus]MBZ9777836.1 metallophosphoesterase [Psychroflexus longus]